MRFWPFARPPRHTMPTVASDALLLAQEALRRDIDEVLLVKERDARGLTLRWGGTLLMEPSRALAAIEPRLQSYGFTPFLKQEGDVTWIEAMPLANAVARPRPMLSLTLFLLTVLSTRIVGGLWSGSLPFLTFDPLKDPMRLLDGAPFAI